MVLRVLSVCIIVLSVNISRPFVCGFNVNTKVFKCCNKVPVNIIMICSYAITEALLDQVCDNQKLQSELGQARVLLSKSGDQQKLENLLEEPQQGSKKVEMFRNWN